MTAFRDACAAIGQALAGDPRRTWAAEAGRAPDLRSGLRRVAAAMRSHQWMAAGNRLNFAPLVRDCDRRARAEGLHVLHDWDGKAGRVNQDSIPVDVLEFVARLRGGEPASAQVAAILIDYYFLYLLALLSLRVWDDGDADGNLDLLDGLLGQLQNVGSGQPFARRAETLLLIATAHYEPDERGYDALLERVRTLNRDHRVHVAASHAAAIGCHLRFGFEATYVRDTSLMRQDNCADYPWLCFSLATLMQEYVRLREAGATTAPVAEALVNGLSADARAFVGEPPASLSACDAERRLFRDLFLAHRAELIQAFERFRPSEGGYSPLAFFFNFSHNVQKGTVVDAALRRRPWPLAIDDLLRRSERGEEADDSPLALANTLMGYARAAPDRIRGRLMPAIVYDPAAGRMAFSAAMQKLRQ
jgi:hypothetical protein